MYCFSLFIRMIRLNEVGLFQYWSDKFQPKPQKCLEMEKSENDPQNSAQISLTNLTITFRLLLFTVRIYCSFVDLPEQPIDSEINRFLNDPDKNVSMLHKYPSILQFSFALTQLYNRAHLSSASLGLDLLFLQHVETDWMIFF